MINKGLFKRKAFDFYSIITCNVSDFSPALFGPLVFRSGPGGNQARQTSSEQQMLLGALGWAWLQNFADQGQRRDGRAVT